MVDAYFDGHDHDSLLEERRSTRGSSAPLHIIRIDVASAKLLHSLGYLHEALFIYRHIYNNQIACSDKCSANYATLLENCCKFDEAILVLRVTRESIHFAPLSTLLLVKLLFTNPMATKENFEAVKGLLAEIDAWPNAERPCINAYKSLWAYVNMIADLMKRDRRQLKQLVRAPDMKKFSHIYVLGDSHIVPFVHRFVKVGAYKNSERFLLRPLLVTGLKAWHTGKHRVFTHQAMLRALDIARGESEIIVSCGEIDVREGLDLAVKKCYYTSVAEATLQTVRVFLSSIAALAVDYDIGRLFLMPVTLPVRCRAKGGKWKKYKERKMQTASWNSTLIAEARRFGPKICVLDYVAAMTSKEEPGCLNMSFAMDGTHANPSLLRELENALNAAKKNV